jgi:hypothetical protein
MTEPTPEIGAQVRARYAAGDRVADILADAGIGPGTLYYWIDGGPDDGDGSRLPPLPRRHSARVRHARSRPAARLSLVKRLWRTAEWQVRDIEDRLRANQMPPDERERDARLLAVMVKTVRELTALRDDNESEDAAANSDDVRRELARKLDALIAKRSAGVPRVAE